MNPPLIQRLRWEGSGQKTATNTTGDRTAMARSGAYLFAAGASMALILFLTLPRPEADTLGMLGTVAAAYALAVAVVVGFDRISEGTFAWIVACGSLVITSGIYFRGAPTTAHALFYLWVTFYSFYFFSRAVALAELAFSVACYASVLSVLEHPPGNRVELWLITLGTLVVAGALISILRDRISEAPGRSRLGLGHGQRQLPVR